MADGLIEALPRLIEKAPVIIEKLVSAIVRNLPKIIQAGGELIGKLVVGILGSLWKLLEIAPQLIRTIVDGIKSLLSLIWNVGNDLILGIWKGMTDKMGWLFNKVKEFATNILKNIKSALGIHSPSKVFKKEVGRNIALGVGEGFTDNLPKVFKDMQNAVDYETSRLGSNMTANSTIDIIRNSNISATLDEINTDKEITVNAITNLDGNVLTSTVNRVNARQRLAYGIGG